MVSRRLRGRDDKNTRIAFLIGPLRHSHQGDCRDPTVQIVAEAPLVSTGIHRHALLDVASRRTSIASSAKDSAHLLPLLVWLAENRMSPMNSLFKCALVADYPFLNMLCAHGSDEQLRLATVRMTFDSFISRVFVALLDEHEADNE